MRYYDHYILAQGGIHNITAFTVAFRFIFLIGAGTAFFGFQLLWLRLTHVVCVFITETVSDVISGAKFCFHSFKPELPAVLPGRAWWASLVALA